MKKLVLILMLLTPVWAFTQTHTFSEIEVVKMDSLFQVYEQNDSLHLRYLNENIVLLNQRIDLYVDLTKELEPKWFKKPVFQFVLGAATIVTSSWVVSNIK